MRLFQVAVAAAAIIIAGRSIQGQTPADEASLRRRIAAHEQASAQNDLRGLVDVYSLDAEMISGTGTVVSGRDAIEAYYRQQLSSASARSGRHHTHPPEAIRIRLVTPDIALVDLPSRSVGGQDAGGKPLAASEVMLITVWRKESGEWMVVSQRALPTPAPPR